MMGLIKRFLNPGRADCAEVRNLASDYLADDLSPKKRSTVHDHLSRCGPCRAFVDTLAATISLLTQIPRVAAPASFKQTIIERAKKSDQSGSD